MADAAELARAMVPLLERGDEALRAHIASLPASAGPVLGSGLGVLHVVTEEDFAANAMLCLRFVTSEAARKPMHILCANGALCALLEQLSARW